MMMSAFKPFHFPTAFILTHSNTTETLSLPSINQSKPPSLSATLSNLMEDEDPSRRRGLDPTPLLHHLITRRTNPTSSSSTTTTTTSNTNTNRLSLLISRATNRRIIPEPSMLVRDSSSSSSSPSSTTAAVRLDDRQNDWGYSKPVVVLDVIWNLAFVLVSTVVVSSTLRERPSTPLRVWIIGYALQCLFHVGFVYIEYRRRNSVVVVGGGGRENEENQVSAAVAASESRSRRLESINTMVSFFWWVLGFYWIVMGGQALLQDAPRLYWLAVVFLAFDVFFAIFCIALACIIGVALCCCLPCIIAILYAVAVQEGASEEDINILPKYKFRQSSQPGKFDLNKKQEVTVAVMEQSSSDAINELALPPEDSECCICLSQYVDGVELHTLPCNHHFHCGCIVKWLRINATCPLCKYNILHGDELV